MECQWNRQLEGGEGELENVLLQKPSIKKDTHLCGPTYLGLRGK
jgi:hypothetical protein